MIKVHWLQVICLGSAIVGASSPSSASSYDVDAADNPLPAPVTYAVDADPAGSALFANEVDPAEMNNNGALVDGGLNTPISPTPLPATLPLFLAGLGGLGLLRRCKKTQRSEPV